MAKLGESVKGILSQSTGSGNAKSSGEKGGGHTKRRIEITVDRHRLFVLKRRGGAVAEWCRHCGCKVQMLTPDQAATIANVSSRTIYRRVEAGELHYMETDEGHLLVCVNSIGLN